MSVEDQIEVRRLLAVTFQELDPTSSPSDTVMRIWSLDLNWTDSKGSAELLEILIQNGWISIDGSIVSCNADLSDIEIPLGWSPMMRRILSGIQMDDSMGSLGGHTSSKIVTKETIVVEESESNVTQESLILTEDRSADPMLNKWRSICDHIVVESGLEFKEVYRRANRKRRACSPMTLWMAFLLLGREQRIDVSSFLE